MVQIAHCLYDLLQIGLLDPDNRRNPQRVDLRALPPGIGIAVDTIDVVAAVLRGGHAVQRLVHS
jgi:hypothetical protein